MRRSRHLRPRPRATRALRATLVAAWPPLDLLDIDGNRHVFDRLRELVASRRAISFVGAGASAGLYPLWPDLVQLLIGEAVKRGLASVERSG